jgi:anti-sigma regulatory factor (Ser/Thr protein kinase)
MYTIETSEDSFSVTFSSTRFLVSKTITDLEDFLLHTWGLQKHSYYSLFIVSRELIENAQVHGNREDPEATIQFRVERTNQHSFRVTVQDEGDGFDYSTINTSSSEDPQHLQQRGYVLISRLAQEISFNQKGNRITAQVTLDGDVQSSGHG